MNPSTHARHRRSACSASCATIPRTVALMIVVPSMLMVLLRYVFDSKAEFNILAPSLLGIFPFTLMFLVTSITTLARAHRSARWSGC